MDLIERYVFAVTARLPVNQRDDVEKELKGLIGEMLSERIKDQQPSRSDVEAILLDLGDPSRLADQYRGSKRYLIGPGSFDTYLMLLKIVAGAVAFGLTVALAIGYVVEPPQNVLQAFGGYISTVFAAVVQAFAWITILFGLFEHYGVKIFDFNKDNKWKPADLPRVPVKQVRIKPVEPILGIIFAVLAIIVFNTANQLIGVYLAGEDSTITVIPLFNKEVFRQYLPYFNVLFILGILKESVKLIVGKWTITLAGINSVLNVASLILVITVFSNMGLWNEGFFQYFIHSGILPSDTDLVRIWSAFTKVFTIVVAFALVLDSVTSVAKAVKHKLAAYL